MAQQIWIVMGLSEATDGSYVEHPEAAFHTEERAKSDLSDNMGQGRVLPVMLHGGPDE